VCSVLATLYPFGVRQPLPSFPLPLKADDQKPLVDIGQFLRELYDRALMTYVLTTRAILIRLFPPQMQHGPTGCCGYMGCVMVRVSRKPPVGRLHNTYLPEHSVLRTGFLCPDVGS